MPRLGLEPTEGANKDGPNPRPTHKEAHTSDATAHKDFARVIAAWPKLPKPIKAAIVAMVESVLGTEVGK